MEDVGETAAPLGYWGLNGYSRNYSTLAPNISEASPSGDELEGIGNSFTPSVKSPSAPVGGLSDAMPSSETRAPFEGPSADDPDAQPSKTSIDIRSRTKESMETRETRESPGIPSLVTLMEAGNPI